MNWTLHYFFAKKNGKRIIKLNVVYYILERLSMHMLSTSTRMFKFKINQHILPSYFVVSQWTCYCSVNVVIYFCDSVLFLCSESVLFLNCFLISELWLGSNYQRLVGIPLNVNILLRLFQERKWITFVRSMVNFIYLI